MKRVLLLVDVMCRFVEIVDFKTNRATFLNRRAPAMGRKRSNRMRVWLVAISMCLTANTARTLEGQTLFNFLGIPKGVQKVKDAMLNRRGNFPGLERKPVRKGMSDPAFLEEEIAKGVKMPKALQEAAKIKIQEDLKAQKIKAVKYLASVGCGTDYNDDKAITAALLEALNDNTEEVRLAAVKAIGKVAKDEAGERCKTKSCCEIEILEQLANMVYARDEYGCYVEPSERVREAALETMQTCCSGEGPVELIEEGEVEPPEGPGLDDSPREPPEGSGDSVIDSYGSRLEHLLASATNEGVGAAPERNTVPVYPEHAAIDRVDLEEGAATVAFGSEGNHVPPGTRVTVYHEYLLGKAAVGQFEVVQQTKNGAVIAPVDRSHISSVSRGDTVTFSRASR